MRWVEHAVSMGHNENCIQNLAEVHGKTPLGKPRRRMEDNIKIDINPLKTEFILNNTSI
jgi:hypothetical protein